MEQVILVKTTEGAQAGWLQKPSPYLLCQVGLQVGAPHCLTKALPSREGPELPAGWTRTQLSWLSALSGFSLCRRKRVKEGKAHVPLGVGRHTDGGSGLDDNTKMMLFPTSTVRKHFLHRNIPNCGDFHSAGCVVSPEKLEG